MQLLAKNVFFIGATCWLLYIWATGERIDDLFLAVPLFFVTLVWLMRHGRKKQRPKVQNTDTQSNQYEEPISISEYGRVSFDKHKFDQFVQGINLAIYLGIILSGIGYFYPEPELFCFICLLIFIGLAATVRGFRKIKRVER